MSDLRKPFSDYAIGRDIGGRGGSPNGRASSCQMPRQRGPCVSQSNHGHSSLWAESYTAADSAGIPGATALMWSGGVKQAF